MLDLFCGRFGWSRAFAARGWECVGVDLEEPPEIPQGCRFVKADILDMEYLIDGGGCCVMGEEFDRGGKPPERAIADILGHFDFICASSPCEEFSVHGMKHFHPNPKYPENGIRLFNHTRELCEASGLPYVMENVRAAQQFIGKAKDHCGSFYLWGNAVPSLMKTRIPRPPTKGFRHAEMFAHDRTNRRHASAAIPLALANCVADYADRRALCNLRTRSQLCGLPSCTW